MTLKELMVYDLKASLEEASNYMTDRLVLEALANNGSVSLEEAEFFNSFVKRIVTEAAEDFVPDEIGAPSQPIMLTDEAGNAYMYQPETGELVPVPVAEEAPVAESTEVVTESTEEVEVSTETEEGTVGEEAMTETEKEVKADAKEMEESTIEEETAELTESQLIVSNLIKSLGA